MMNYNRPAIKKFITENPTLKQKEIAEHLNMQGYTTWRGKQWNHTLVSAFVVKYMKKSRKTKAVAVKCDTVKSNNKHDDKLALIELIIGLEMSSEQKLTTIKAVLL